MTGRLVFVVVSWAAASRDARRMKVRAKWRNRKRRSRIRSLGNRDIGQPIPERQAFVRGRHIESRSPCSMASRMRVTSLMRADNAMATEWVIAKQKAENGDQTRVSAFRGLAAGKSARVLFS